MRVFVPKKVHKNYFITPMQNQGFPDAWSFFIL